MVPGLALEQLRREVHRWEVQERDHEQILRRRHWRIHRNHMRHRKRCMMVDMLADSILVGSMSALA